TINTHERRRSYARHTSVGFSIFEAKRELHPRVYPFPSSIDGEHFWTARDGMGDIPELAGIPHPRLGYYGAIDDRIDLGLIAGIADLEPDWHWCSRAGWQTSARTRFRDG